MNRVLGVATLLVAAGPALAATDPDTAALAERVVSQHVVRFTAPPDGVPSRDSARGPLLGNGGLGAVIGGPPQAQRFWLSKNNFWRLKDGHRQGGPRLFGGLDVEIAALDGGSYLVEQQLHPAIAVSRFAKGGSTVTMRSLVVATADVLLVELTVAGEPVDVQTRLWAAPGRGSREEAGCTDGLAWATKAFAEEVKIPSSCAAALAIHGVEPVLDGGDGTRVLGINVPPEGRVGAEILVGLRHEPVRGGQEQFLELGPDAKEIGRAHV
mgnify:CR=1 FL=1